MAGDTLAVPLCSLYVPTARIAHHGVGEFVGIDEALTADGLAGLVRQVMQTPSYRENAQRFRRIIADSNGLDVAAAVVEAALAKVHNAELVTVA